MNDVVPAFGGCKVIEQGADCLPESSLSSCRRRPEQRLELGEKLLDRVEIRGIDANGVRREGWHNRRWTEPTRCPMPKPNDLSRSLTAFEQDRTLLAVIEMSHTS